MTELETSLQYEYIKGEDQPKGLNIQANGSFVRTHNLFINTNDRAQRISIYENGLIISDEVYSGKHILRFNHPFTEVERGKLVFNI
ncbi:hypothetical protein BK708_16980 [Bacillus thuringiensis serovar yunnanensis]|nr:hypothetical protein BK708_16980 [Bacillus thuringiensis serovar yunnanensis]